MNARVWQIAALVLITAAAGFVCYDSFLPAVPDYGFISVTSQQAGEERIRSVRPGSTAARAGIKPGDLVSFGETPLQRAQAYYSTPGTPVPVTINRRPAFLTASAQPPPSISPLLLVIRLAFLGVAGLLAWRRPQDAAARALATFLASYGVLIGLGNGLLPSPLLSALVLTFGTAVTGFAGLAAAAVFGAVFPSGIAKPVPRRVARATQTIAAAAIVIVVLATGNVVPPGIGRGGLLLVPWLFLLCAALVIVTLVAAYVLGAPSERQRRRWVFLMLGIGLAAVGIDVIVQSTLGISEVVDYTTLLVIAAIPFGLAYAILRHRVIDVGFVISRALVYGAVSVIVVGVFVIVETLVSKYVEQHSRAGSIAVQLAVALVLGFSIRFIHARVDRVVDRLLFRQRYLDEAALRDFTHDAHYITNAPTLLERCDQTVRRHAHGTNAGVWLRDGSGFYRPEHASFPQAAAVDENDPAFVAMRARRVVADLPALGSALPGALAFPMIVRGELIGALVCGVKTLGESYDPDETAALRELASAVGHAIDAMRIRELEAEVERLERVRQIGLAGS